MERRRAEQGRAEREIRRRNRQFGRMGAGRSGWGGRVGV